MSDENENKTHKEIDDSFLLDNYKSTDLKIPGPLEKELNNVETNIEDKKESKVEEIPLLIKILFSLPSFSKMSCLLILK